MSSPTQDQLAVLGAPEDALRALAEALGRRLIKRGPQQIPYLFRSYLGLEDTDGIGGFLHEFVASDDNGELHCHPWAWSVSFILAGRYEEVRTRGRFWPRENRQEGESEYAAQLDWEPRVRVCGPGDRNIIGPDHFHQVNILTPSVHTLFIHGPRVQPWGFVPAGRPEGEILPVRLIRRRTHDLPKVEVTESTTIESLLDSGRITASEADDLAAGFARRVPQANGSFVTLTPRINEQVKTEIPDLWPADLLEPKK